MSNLNGLFFPSIAFLFALFFYYASRQKSCWYKRYIFPAMFTFIAALFIKNPLAVVFYLLAAILSYFGYKGYGKEKIKQSKEVEKE